MVGEASFVFAVLKSSVSGSSGSGPTRRILRVIFWGRFSFLPFPLFSVPV